MRRSGAAAVEPVLALAPWSSVMVALEPLVQVVLIVPLWVRSVLALVTIGSYAPNETPPEASIVQLALTVAETGRLEVAVPATAAPLAAAIATRTALARRPLDQRC